MPNYRYGCAFCNAECEEFRPMADRTRLPLCPTCGAPMTRVYVMPFISADLTPTSRPETAATNAREKRWDRDMAAYARVTKQGIQPRRIDGCADLEKGAETSHEWKLGKLMQKRDVKDGVDMASEMVGKDLEL